MSFPSRQPTYYIPHGGGPCFFMDWPGDPHAWDKLAAWLRGLVATLPERPKAILVVSGHWETQELALTGAAKPELIYDYYGFPEHTYRLQFPASGDPALAARVSGLLNEAGLPAHVDPERGYDHGVFIPFLLVTPEADIPVLQLSLHRSLDPALHLRIGRALAPLRDEGVLIVGSGMSFHNLRMRGSAPGRAVPGTEEFDQWLTAAVEAEPAERDTRLTDWESAPHARFAHPREEHLIPLMVVAGAAPDEPGRRTFDDLAMGWRISGYRFG
ncbi:DODA-type extradiol aromatic ring-opening family dioxygenase [Derxia gummosa]|uniref:DODA-type extradiol aromatic ring-opening family dioxygenase n=1 Tax=Derxia gummosa DSM 723 TaxID=1121388 RepID=A0A8B6X7M5_9BURK|nr:class III extradiol ring-cleavage dioxygenase [Derxia gummosa]